MTYQDLVFSLERFWADHGCLIMHSYDCPVGAGTMCPATFLWALGPEPVRVAYVQPSRRPSDGRYGDNPNRFQKHLQYQVLLKPSPAQVQEMYLASLEAIGLDLATHDVKFVEDDWEAPTLGAAGVGWEVRLDGMEITQFTYFQQAGSLPCKPVSVELTYGLERLSMYLQDVDDYRNLKYNDTVNYGDLKYEEERQFSVYNFDAANVDMLWKLFDLYEAEAQHLINQNLPLPAHDYVLYCSHTFNLMDARGAVSITERPAMIERVRNLARAVAKSYVRQRDEMGFPLLQT
ncbi:MAG: glycine--tRNA ligase subunit alpha [candidate division WS1 bacterium]|jgi:glycyl-tRNA synthetase alpha chain|nr:glycine--tRNA ligase subunit alpha [candidate division WS1 bacterium]